MRKIFSHLIPFMLLPIFIACGQEGTTRLIVRGDDMGFTHAANEACIDAYKNGIMKTVEVMVPTPWYPEAVRLLKENPGLDVGVHLTLTSEWDALKWKPLTKAPSLSDENGYFYPMIWPNENFGKEQALKENGWTLEAIEQELRAQIEQAQKDIPQLSHLTAHMGCTNIAPDVSELFFQLGEEYGLDIFPDKLGVERGRYQGEKATLEQKLASFSAMLRGLEKGKTYLFVDHPAYDTPEMKHVRHKGYEKVAVDRQGVTDMLKHPDIKKLVEELNIQLISYASLGAE